jgi:two-component system sensor histidine kinase DctS
VSAKLPPTWRRWAFWGLIVALLSALLVLLVFLARQYQEGLNAAALERNAADIATDIRSGLTRNVQLLVGLQNTHRSPDAWQVASAEFLDKHPEVVHLEWRNNDLDITQSSLSPYIPLLYNSRQRPARFNELSQACLNANRISGAAYSPTHFWPIGGGMGVELIEMCLPVQHNGAPDGYLVATYAMIGMLRELVSPTELRGKRLLWTDPQGVRLATFDQLIISGRIQTAQQLVDLPGQTLVLGLEQPYLSQGWFPHVLTAVVGALASALLLVMALLARDLRRRQAAERQLAEALAFRKAMEDSLVTGLRARDMQGRITYVNPAFCQMVGRPAHQLLGQGIPAPYWPEDQIDNYRHRQAIRMAGKVVSREGYESEFVRSDGTRFPVLIIEAPLMNDQGQQTGWMSAIIDLSEQRKSEEMVRASHERLQATARLAMAGEMASMISHELNQPLAAIASYASGSLNLLQEPPATQAWGDIRQAMQRISEQAERAGKVIRGVTELMRRGEGQRQCVEIDELKRNTLPLMQLQARHQDITLQWVVDDACTTVWCDRTMIEQVLLNLARNGMQAMPSGSPSSLRGYRRLIISVAPTSPSGKAPMVLWRVQDFGQGISAQQAELLFTPFFTTKPEGMGLGLSLCRTIVEQHGGTLQFEPGLPFGTVFSFMLPSCQPL